MQLEFRQLDAASEEAYACLLEQVDSSMLYHSLKYRAFLKRILPDAEDYYLLGYSDGKLVGAMPTFRRTGEYGTIVNSLPFYGSHGSLVARLDLPADARLKFFEKFEELCRAWDTSFSTIVSTPLDDDPSVLDSIPSDYTDDRIGQIIELPAASDEQDIGAAVMAMMHQKTRNSVRKGVNAGFDIGDDGSNETFDALIRMHHENMATIGGAAKPRTVFEAIREVFEYGADYKIYWAKNEEGAIVSALLVLYFKGWAEYFVPTTDAAHRSSQPLSALIYAALQDAVANGMRYWNWGGTWLSQDGVYKFKARWGTRDFPYRYHIRCFRGLQGVTKQGLLEQYPYFFSLPFSILEA